MSTPTPFQVDIEQSTIDGILSKAKAYQWHEMPEIEPGGDRWAYGADMEYMKELCAYWVSEFDWRAAEAKLNAYPQFKANVEDQEIHFYHVEGSGSAPQPMILTHGWPGSVFEFLEVIDLLAHPERHGGDAEDGLTLVIPSLPGYGFSGKPKKPLGPKRTAELWDKLMRDTLGYDTYIAQGGDWGSIVSGFIAYNHGTNKGGGCKAVHLNMWGLRSDTKPETEEEQAWAAAAGFDLEMEGAYLRLQMTKPQSLSYAMMDSPVGVAAWITEKFNGWSDIRGEGGPHIENAYTKDQLLTNIMIYLVTGTFNTATWFYRGMFEEGGTNMAPGDTLQIPTGFMRMPEEGKFISIPPRSLAEKAFNIVHWTEPEKGGHFAALETGPVFADDVRAFAKQMKG